MADLNIEIRDNGPYLIRGGVTVKDAGGNAFETQDVVALCRCGLSAEEAVLRWHPSERRLRKCPACQLRVGAAPGRN